MLIDVDVAVRPERPIEVERHLLELPRVLRDACHPPREQVAHLLEAEVGALVVSSVMSPPTCIGVTRFSTERNKESVAESLPR